MIHTISSVCVLRLSLYRSMDTTCNDIKNSIIFPLLKYIVVMVFNNCKVGLTTHAEIWAHDRERVRGDLMPHVVTQVKIGPQKGRKQFKAV